MSRPHYDWWCNATRMIRNYPARKAEHDDLVSQSVTADMSGMPHSGGAGRSTEAAALHQMAPAKQAEYDAVRKAIEITEMLPNGELRIRLIRRIYWGEKKQPIHRAVGSLNIAEATGWRWHSGFVKLVGECFGYIV